MYPLFLQVRISVLNLNKTSTSTFGFNLKRPLHQDHALQPALVASGRPNYVSNQSPSPCCTKILFCFRIYPRPYLLQAVHLTSKLAPFLFTWLGIAASRFADFCTSPIGSLPQKSRPLHGTLMRTFHKLMCLSLKARLCDMRG